MKIHLSPHSQKSHGVTEAKKAELDSLTSQVLDAQLAVDTHQAIVNSVAAKQTNIQTLLSIADNNKVTSLNNRNVVNELVQKVIELKTNSAIAMAETQTANTCTDKIATGIKTLIDRLIYSAEIVNKLSALIIRRKAINPLVSDDLITMVGTAGNNANNAISLTLVALTTSFAAQASNTESLAAMTLVSAKAKHFADSVSVTQLQSLPSLLHEVYNDSCLQYDRTFNALTIVTNQLNLAQAQLNKAQINLQSLQAGLAAANAAALAS
jgi:hypothetical protein